MKVSIGISTCPNDTYAFAALLEGWIPTGDFELQFELLDVETLNARWLEGDFDIAKASFHAALRATESSIVLSRGSAIGVGNGPVLIGSPGRTKLEKGARVLAPGEHTTATLLYRLAHPDHPPPRHVVFSEIFPALLRGEADFGVCIHEGRFTYADHGLEWIEDLGDTWQRTTGAAIPLGGILGRRALGETTLHAIDDLIGASITFARSNPDAVLPVMKRYAQEGSDEVLWKHVELYVTQATAGLSAQDTETLRTLDTTARRAGILPADAPLLAVLG